MSETAINILEITNTGSAELEIHFYPHNSAGIGIALPVNATSKLLSIPLGQAGDRLHFTVHLQNASQPARMAKLYFEEENGMNQFYVATYRSGEMFTAPAQTPPTTPGKNIFLHVNYDGDGVVIVGTGEL